MKFDELIVHHLGEFGPYQKRQFLLVCLPTIFTAMHALSWTFSGANPLHRCRLPDEVGVDVEATGGYWLNGSEAVMGNSLLKEQHCDLKAHPGWPRCPYDSCEMSNGNPCRAGYVYDLSELHYSATYRVIIW
jgi:OCT family organic cation transporter-like MFS transporter 4/5